MGWHAAVLLVTVPTVRSTIGGACSNSSYTLPLSRRRIAPSASALESFQQKIIALARNASALEIRGPTTDIGGLYAQLAWASVDIVNWSEQDGAVTRVETGGAEASGGYRVAEISDRSQHSLTSLVRLLHRFVSHLLGFCIES